MPMSEAGYLVERATGEMRPLDESLNPADFGAETWAQVHAERREVDLVDGWGWFADRSDAERYAEEFRVRTP